MATLFITFRYIAFALFIIFSSIICILGAVNLGALLPHTPSFPQIDVFLILTGAFALLFIFPVIFTELVRKNAFISRVIVEVAWLAILWLMNIAGAAALIALSSQIRCFPTGTQSQMACSSFLALLTFSWLNTITMLAYLLCLVVSSVYHAQQNNIIWSSSVRDYQWFASEKSPPPAYEPRLMQGPSPITPRTRRSSNYARQIGLTTDYRVEPLRIPHLPQIVSPTGTSLDLPPPPTPVGRYLSRVYSYNDYNRRTNQGEDPSPSLPTPVISHAPVPTSLYPQHLLSMTAPVNPPRPGNDPSPPPAGEWPRKKPQEPSRRKHSKRRPRAQSSDNLTTVPSSSQQPDRRARSSSRPLTGPRPRPAPLQVDIPR